MNTTTTRPTHAVMIAAALAALLMTRSVQAAPAGELQVVTLPRVMVTGQREHFAPAQVVRLPRVMVTGHRIDSADPVQAHQNQAPARRVVIVASR
jgi:hypothetical protein